MTLDRVTGDPLTTEADGDSTFPDRLRAGLRACGVEAGAAVLVAVSGGADSVALLRGLASAASGGGWRLAAAHLDHGLRGEQSRADAAWVASLCDRWRVPCEVAHEELAAFAAAEGLGLEAAGRRLRYEFLAAAAQRAGCGFVATGHTADDQAETILHHIVRGTGVAGLRGMPRRRRLSARVELVRPLLEMRRDEVRTWLDAIGQDFREDMTNRDERFTRNRIRHQLLPLLEREFNPEAAAAILRLGRQAAEIDEVLSILARRLLDRALLDRSETTSRLDCRILAGEPRFLIREVLRRLWSDLDWPCRSMGYAEWETLAELALGPGGAATLPGGIQAVKRGDLLVLTR